MKQFIRIKILYDFIATDLVQLVQITGAVTKTSAYSDVLQL